MKTCSLEKLVNLVDKFQRFFQTWKMISQYKQGNESFSLKVSNNQFLDLLLTKLTLDLSQNLVTVHFCDRFSVLRSNVSFFPVFSLFFSFLFEFVSFLTHFSKTLHIYTSIVRSASLSSLQITLCVRMLFFGYTQSSMKLN